jgi:transcriptional regulator with XRE-family HTH domain
MAQKREYKFIEFAHRLTSLAKKNGLAKPCDVARVTGLNRITLGSYMRGERAASMEACIQIANKLGGDPHWLHSGNQGTILRGGQRSEKHAAFKEPLYIPKDRVTHQTSRIEQAIAELVRALDEFSKTIAY